MKHADFVEADLPAVYELANEFKTSGYILSDYEALRLAIELIKKNSVDGLGALADILEGASGPISIKIEDAQQ